MRGTLVSAEAHSDEGGARATPPETVQSTILDVHSSVSGAGRHHSTGVESCHARATYAGDVSGCRVECSGIDAGSPASHILPYLYVEAARCQQFVNLAMVH